LIKLLRLVSAVNGATPLPSAWMAALCRKRQSPLGLGQPRSWACGIVYVLGRVNFLDDPSFSPHVKTAELAAAFGVSEATIHAKARFIEKALSVAAIFLSIPRCFSIPRPASEDNQSLP
jgi:hypothetical protein